MSGFFAVTFDLSKNCKQNNRSNTDSLILSFKFLTMNTSNTAEVADTKRKFKISGLRWWVVALVGLATVINYIDRQALNILYPEAFADIFPDKTTQEHKEIYALVSLIFILAYAMGQAAFGKIFDWLGTRIGFVLSIGVWSAATVAHAVAKGLFTFSLFRAILGFSEAGNWPGATKANAEWFPIKERAIAQGIFNSGAAIGGILAISLIGYLSIFLSWKMIFVIIGVAGLLWLIPWLIIVKGPPQVHNWLTDTEKEYILSGQHRGDQAGEIAPLSIKEILSKRQSWGIIIASAVLDPIWWIFVFWIPTYLLEVYNLDIKGVASIGWIPYGGAALGAWFGGILAHNRMSAGWSVNKTRKFIITLGGLIMLPGFFALSNPSDPLLTVFIMAVVCFGFQTTINNVQTLPGDYFSGKSVGTLAGLAGMAAKLSAAALATVLVPWMTVGGNYASVFIMCVVLAILTVATVFLVCGHIGSLEDDK